MNRLETPCNAHRTKPATGIRGIPRHSRAPAARLLAVLRRRWGFRGEHLGKKCEASHLVVKEPDEQENYEQWTWQLMPSFRSPAPVIPVSSLGKYTTIRFDDAATLGRPREGQIQVVHWRHAQNRHNHDVASSFKFKLSPARFELQPMTDTMHAAPTDCGQCVGCGGSHFCVVACAWWVGHFVHALCTSFTRQKIECKS